MGRKLKIWATVAGLALSFALRADEVPESALAADGDTYSQLVRIQGVLQGLGVAPLPVSVAAQPVLPKDAHGGADEPGRPYTTEELFVDFEPTVGEVRPVRAGGNFNPRTFDSLTNLKSTFSQLGDGVGQPAAVKFGDRKELSLRTIGSNNAQSQSVEELKDSSFEEQFARLSSADATEDYVTYRDFISQYEDVIRGRSGPQAERFRQNAEAAFAAAGDVVDLNNSAEAFRRFLDTGGRSPASKAVAPR